MQTGLGQPTRLRHWVGSVRFECNGFSTSALSAFSGARMRRRIHG
jgi:hypothetical protein